MSTKSIKDPSDRLATLADVLAVIDAASASIAGLEARIVALEEAKDCRHDISLAQESRPSIDLSGHHSDSDGDSGRIPIRGEISGPDSAVTFWPKDGVEKTTDTPLVKP